MQPDNFFLKHLPIRLGQFLKVTNIANDGIHAKHIIGNGEIRVNDIVVRNRGKQLVEGDRVEYLDKIHLRLMLK